jgi:hypothetical protein
MAPRYPTAAESRGGHDWVVEFGVAPRDQEAFAQILDETLQGLNPDYRIKRSGEVGMTAPRVIAVPPGTFYRWMRETGRIGDQHKVPRVTNTRSIAGAVLAAAAAPSTREPAASAGRLATCD